MVRYAYDALGRVTQRTTDVEIDYTYDPLGRLSHEHNPLGAFGYDYLGDTSQLAARSLATPSGRAGLELDAEYDNDFGDRQLRRLTYRAGGHRLTAQLTYTRSPEHLLTSAMTVAPGCPGRDRARMAAMKAVQIPRKPGREATRTHMAPLSKTGGNLPHMPAWHDTGAMFHNHPLLDGYDYNHFSFDDKDSAVADNIPSYLLIPDGTILRLTPRAGGRSV